MTTHTDRRRTSGSRTFRAALYLLATLAASLCQPGTAFAQWTTSGNDISNTNTGNVGIGASAPAEKLTVAGSIIAKGSSTIPGSQFIISNNDTIGPWIGSHTDRLGNSTANYAASRWNVQAAGMFFQFSPATPIGSARTWTTRMAINASDGNVGIGTSSPAAKLDVRGSIALDGTVPTAHAATNYSSLWLKNNVALISEIAPGYSIATLGTNFQRSGGTWSNVDTSMPTWSLSMGAGSGYDLFELNHSPSGTYTRSTFMVVNSSGNVGIGTTTPSRKLELAGDVGGLSFEAASGSPNSGAIRFGDNSGWKFHFGRSRNSAGGALNSGTAGVLMTIQDNGNVGIGVTSPGYKLDVQGGQLNASGGLCIAGDCKTAWSQVGGGGSSQWTTSGANISYSGGNVGVGATAPAARLSVGGNGVNLYNSTDLWVENNAHVQGSEILTQGGRGRMRVGSAWSYVGLYAEPSSTGAANDLLLGAVSGIVRVGPNVGVGPTMSLIVPNGSVGIGTTSPAAKLDVSGGYLHVAGLCGGTIPDLQGAYLSWNHNCGSGETDLINHQGWGTGGFAFKNTSNGSSLTTLMSISGSGDLTVSGNISAKYQDVAEWVPSTQKLKAGTVVVLDTERSNHVLASNAAYDTRVAGVISESPGVILGEAGADKLKVATTGRVKVKVDATRAPIKVGDLLVTSGTEGVAMKSVEVDLGGVKLHRPGTIIGKALEPLPSGVGEILVLLSLQ